MLTDPLTKSISGVKMTHFTNLIYKDQSILNIIYICSKVKYNNI